MSREDFEVISVLGPLGSGKTTTLNQLIEQVPLSDRYAVVVNDVGEHNIDAQRIWDHPANRSDRIIPLTAGCIGCSDATQFREALERVHDAGVNVLFIEPTGIAPGTEIADVVRSSGFDLSILTLTNAKTIERDLKWQVLPSQLAVADVIGITHIPEGHDDAEVMEAVLEQLPLLPEEVSMELVKPGFTDYFELLARLRGMERELQLGRSVLHDVCHIDHPHDHSHDHTHCHEGHGVSAKSFLLKDSITVEQVRELLLPLSSDTQTPLLRAKGYAGGYRFDLVGEDWQIVPEPDAHEPTMNVIFGGSMPQNFLQLSSTLCEAVRRVEITGDKKAIVKSISEMSKEDRTAIIEQRITQYPAPVSVFHGELIPDCEADEGYEIAFWGNRDDMPDEVKRSAMDAYISFRMKGLHELLHHNDSIVHTKDKAAYWLRRYGATLGYNGYHLAEYIDTMKLAQIRAYNPAQMLIDGLLQLSTLTFDEGRAEEKPEFVAGVLKPALDEGHINPAVVTALHEHLMTLTKDKPDYCVRWQKTFETLGSYDR